MGQVINMLEAVHRLSSRKFRQVNQLMNKAFEFEENGVTHAAEHISKLVDVEMERINRYDNFISSQSINDFHENPHC